MPSTTPPGCVVNQAENDKPKYNISLCCVTPVESLYESLSKPLNNPYSSPLYNPLYNPRLRRLGYSSYTLNPKPSISHGGLAPLGPMLVPGLFPWGIHTVRGLGYGFRAGLGFRATPMGCLINTVYSKRILRQWKFQFQTRCESSDSHDEVLAFGWCSCTNPSGGIIQRPIMQPKNHRKGAHTHRSSARANPAQVQ